ncbi:MAG: hypothetical protein OXK78_13120 [Caldilineaceae bacterium]|nr:hypothetical protein [Caldilineaceae bacterium]
MSESLEGRISGDRQPRMAASARLFVLLLIVALSLSACNIRNPFAPRAEPTAAETAGQLEEGSPLFLLVERAKEDLMQTAGADSDEITLVSTEEVEWGDTSLGCPHPDEMYAQMITPGYFIVLQSGGNTYDYHTGADPEGPLVQCTEDGTPAGAVIAQPEELEEGEEETRIDAEDALPRLIERATEDIIQATGAASDAITVVSTEEVEWSDTSLGCPDPDTMYAQVITPGYLIVLESEGNTFNYHTATDPAGPIVQCTEDGTPAAMAMVEIAPQMVVEDPLSRLVERATEDLMQAAGAASDEITVLSTEEVEWSDTSLGCPEPDGMYAQMITPGYLIVLETGGESYNYHTSTDPEGPLVHCTLEAESDE